MEGSRLRVELFGPHHIQIRNDFDCGVEALDRYLAERARREHAAGVARVHIFYDSEANRIAGFYTLSSISVRAAEVPATLTKRLTSYSELPATLIGRLAADLRYRGQGLGRLLVLDALTRIQRQSQEVGSLLVIVDAKDTDVVAFYKKFGFQSLPDHPLKLFLPTATIHQLFPEA
jgi:GNAT superfamily N-acetyltransferase